MKLLCLDSNSILNRAFYGIKLLTAKDGTYTNAVYGFLNILHKLLQEVQPDCVVFAFDLKAPTFRHKMYDGYKAQRKGMPPELAQQLPIIQELLTDLGYRIVTREGFEADDILGSYAALCEKEGHHCWIATGDRDSLQLIGPNTTVLLTTTRMGRSRRWPGTKKCSGKNTAPSPRAWWTSRLSWGTARTTSPACRASAKRPPSSSWASTAA